MGSTASRRMHRTIEPIHAMVYFAPEAQEEYTALGLEGQAELYFPSRAAPLGRVPWQVVQSTFFVFSPLAVQFGMTEAWSKTTPEAVIEARLRGVDRALKRMAGGLLDDVDEALELVRDAVSACRVEGRPLFAAYTGLPEPAEPVLALWHGLGLLREYRGDGHIVALLAAGLTAPQALVLNGAYVGGEMTRFLQQTRAWSREEWDEAVAQLARRGWVDAHGALTDEGTNLREAVEVHTDELAGSPWQHLGEARTERLRELLTPLSKAVLDAGGLPVKVAR